ncbi:MAG: hypothetical protein ABWW69_07290 [Pyrodictiaceae archaeon]
MSRKLRMIRRLERHLRKHPNDRVAREILEALRKGRYRWKGRSLVIVSEEEAGEKSESS